MTPSIPGRNRRYIADVGKRWAPAARVARLHKLRDEAGQAGDLEQVAICDRALNGDEAARAECERVIAAAAANE